MRWSSLHRRNVWALLKDSKTAWYCLMEKRCLEEYTLLKKEFHVHFDRFIAETLVEDYLEDALFRSAGEWS